MVNNIMQFIALFIDICQQNLIKTSAHNNCNELLYLITKTAPSVITYTT